MGFKTIKNAASDIVKTNIWKKFAKVDPRLAVEKPLGSGSEIQSIITS